jgi:hypothetical protein
MKFTKIFDVTDTDSVTSPTEIEANKQLQYDDEMLEDDDESVNIQHDLEVLLPESKEMMSDWTCAEIKVDEIKSDEVENDERRNDLSPTGSNSSNESLDSFYKPEADQSDHDQILSDHVVHALRRDAKDYAKIARDVEE